MKVDEAKTLHEREVLAVEVAEKPTIQSTAGKMLLTMNKARLILKLNDGLKIGLLIGRKEW